MIQNGANSSVGQAVIQLARLRGIKTINVVRASYVLTRTHSLTQHSQTLSLSNSLVMQFGLD